MSSSIVSSTNRRYTSRTFVITPNRLQASDPNSFPTADIKDMRALVLKHAVTSIRLSKYLSAVDHILYSKDEAIIKRAYQSLQEFMEETGVLVWIGGLTGVADKVASEFGKHI